MKLSLNLLQQPLAWSALGRRVAEGLGRIGQFVFLTHQRAAKRILVALGLAAALYLVLVLLYLPPPGVAAVEEEQVRLDVTAIERMVSWMEERAQKRAAGRRVTTEILAP